MKKPGSIFSTISKNYTLLIIAVIPAILLMVTGIYTAQLGFDDTRFVPKAVKGEFDLTEFDLNERKPVPLQGEVEFYWQEFLTPEDFSGKNTPSPRYLEIPTAWNDLLVDGEKVGGKGYGTFRFKIRVKEAGLYAIKIKEFESAFNIWVNSKDLGGAGTVGTSRKDMTPSWHRKEYYFCVPEETIEVILHVSNFHHRLGGASEPIYFGTAKTITTVKLLRSQIESFLMGILLILVLYHFTLYHYRRTDRSILYFSLTCLFILLRLCTTGEKLLLDFIPFIPWSIAIRLEYISLPLIGAVIIGFFRNILPGSIPTWFKHTINIPAMVICGMIILLPASIFTYSAYLISVMTCFLIIGLFIFLLKARIRKERNSGGLFWGYAMLCIVMVNDILFYLDMINTAFMLPFGLIILLLTQAFIISRNSSLAFVEVERLSKMLEKHAEELEETVEKRTKELREQAEMLDKTNNKLLELDTFKKEMTRMMVHDLKNPLGNMIGLIQLPDLSRDNRDLIIYSGNEMQNLIQNILDVTKFEETELKLYLGKALLYELADAAYQQNKYNFTLNSIRFENKVSRDLIIDADKELIIRVFVNILSNAGKYLKNEKLIRISSDIIIENKKKFHKISIFNTGESIPEDKLEAIFDVYHQIYAQRDEFKYSTGIGLTFCKMAIEAHGGKIGAINEGKEKGVTFWFTLPVTGNQ